MPRDEFEDNDSADGATPIIAGVLRNLMSCGDDEDWHVVTLPAQHAATVSIRQLDNGANLSLTVLNSGEVELGRSASDQPVEALVVGPFPSEQNIFVVVGQQGPSGAAQYGLEVELMDEGAGCIDDAYENGNGDDTLETGRVVRAPGELGFGDDLSGRICPMDSDFVCFHAGAREQVITIDVAVTGGDAVINAQVYRPNGDSAMASQFSRDKAARPSFFGPAPGYTAWGWNPNRGPALTVSQCAVPSAVASMRRSNSADAGWEWERLYAGPTQWRECDVFLLCAGGTANSAEAVYTVSFQDEDELPLLLSASVVGLPSGTLGDPVVSIRRTCGDGSTEMAFDRCSGSHGPKLLSGFPATVRVPVTEPGEYAIWVDGVDSVPGRLIDYR